MQTHFSRHGAIVGGAVRTYLLEKSRWWRRGGRAQPPHLLRAARRRRQGRARAAPAAALGQVRCLQHGTTAEPTPLAPTLQALACVGVGPAHAAQLLRLLAALLHLSNITFTPRADVAEGSHVADGSGTAALGRACHLLRCAPAAMAAALTSRALEAAGEKITVGLTPAAAAQARDAISRAIYSRVFNHVVRCVNRSLGDSHGRRLRDSPSRMGRGDMTARTAAADEEEAAAAAAEAAEAEAEAEGVAAGADAEAEALARLAAEASAGSDYWSDAPVDMMPSPAPRAARPRGSFSGSPWAGMAAGSPRFSSKKSWARTPPPGVKGANATYAGRICALDIFGFECFERNGFEQLCINYTNEALQQLFTKVVFDEQQAEYEREGLVWTRLPYDDNAKVLSLLDGPQGVLPLLDEQCYLGERGSDAGFARSVTTRHGKHDCLSTPRIQSEAGELRSVTTPARSRQRRRIPRAQPRHPLRPARRPPRLLRRAAAPRLPRRARRHDAAGDAASAASTQAAGFKTQLGAR